MNVAFFWWCRDWMQRDISGNIPDHYYESQFFGRNLVVALPSTVHGYFWDRRQIDILLAQRQIIAVEEHIAPIRPDGQIQTPNIIDDLEELRRLFGYLRGKNVWYATGSEIASYVVARERSFISDVTRDGFTIRYDGRVDRPQITLWVNCAAVCTPTKPLIEVILPDGTIPSLNAYRFDMARYHHLVTVPVMEGRYYIQPHAA